MEAVATDYTKVDRLIEKSEKELNLLKGGSDDGQLPMRDLLSTLRDVTGEDPALASINMCATAATGYVETVLDTLQPWSETDLVKLREFLTELKALREDPTRVYDAPPVDFSKIDHALDKLAVEINLLNPGSDSGLLPIRDLFSRIRDKSAGAHDLINLNTAAVFATDYVERVLETLSPWTSEQIEVVQGLLAQVKAIRYTPESVFERPDAAEPTNSFAAFEQPLETPAHDESIIPLIIDANTDGDMLKEFIVESNEHLSNIENGVLELENVPDDKETLNTIFRAFHTFKGSSGFLNLTPINKLAHELETLLDLARNNKLKVDKSIIDIILEGGDVLKQFVIGMQQQIDGKMKPGPILIPIQSLINRAFAIAKGEPAPVAAAPKALPAPVHATAPTPAASQKVVARPPAPAAPAPARPTHQANVAAAAQAKAAEVPSGNEKAAIVKVDTSKLDNLFDLVGEMVIGQSLVAQDPEIKALNSQRVNRNIAQLSRITDELQKTAMSMRMVPIRGTFQKMNRVVRDISAKIGKKIELQTRGDDTELDRTIVEEISDPLLHMVRNSVDHGVETPEKRLAKGKSESGTIMLSAFHEGGNIVIQIEDNGAGINKDRVLAKAIEKGIVSADDELSDQEIFQLIFAPGFSTAEVLTDISGRGVGMDVVRRNIEKLRGKIEIQSTTDVGSVFTIYLPLTLAIIEGLIVRVGDQRYILPTLSVRESFRPTMDMISTIHETNEIVNVRGNIYPLIRLHEYFNIPVASNSVADGIIVILEAGHSQACLLVDDLIGKQEVVIKSLGYQFKTVKALAGAAILGDGSVGLILDASSIINQRKPGAA